MTLSSMPAGDVRAEILEICTSIANTSLDPVVGARQIWVRLAEASYPLELESFRVFVGMVSEIDDSPEHRDGYTTDILEEARRVVVKHQPK